MDFTSTSGNLDLKHCLKKKKFTEEFCRYRWEQDPAVQWDQEGSFLIFVSDIFKMFFSGCCSSTGILFPSVTEG